MANYQLTGKQLAFPATTYPKVQSFTMSAEEDILTITIKLKMGEGLLQVPKENVKDGNFYFDGDNISNGATPTITLSEPGAPGEVRIQFSPIATKGKKHSTG
jgi:hypothetical protein